MAKTAPMPSLFDDPAVLPPVAVAAPDKAAPPAQQMLNLFDQMLGKLEEDGGDRDDDNIFDVSGLEHVAGKTVAEIFGWEDCPTEEISEEPVAPLQPPIIEGQGGLLPRPMLQTSAPFSPFQGAEAMEWEMARTAFGHAVRAAGRDEEILTYTDFVTFGKLDHRKLARLANSLLGLVASQRPEPTTEEWRKAVAALQGAAQ